MAKMRNVLPLFSTQLRETGQTEEKNSEDSSSGSSFDAPLLFTHAKGLPGMHFQAKHQAHQARQRRAALATSRRKAVPSQQSAGTSGPSDKKLTDAQLSDAKRKLEHVTALLSAGSKAPAGPSGGNSKSKQTDLDGQLRASLTQASLRMMTAQFVTEVRRVLKEQQLILPLLANSRAWTLKVLNRQYYAIRTAAEMLKQDNLATVAGRAEVLVSLLSRNVIEYRNAHQEVLHDTWDLLDSIAQRMASDGSDRLCFTTARAAICLFATAEPTTEEYAPAVVQPGKPQQNAR